MTPNSATLFLFHFLFFPFFLEQASMVHNPLASHLPTDTKAVLE